MDDQINARNGRKEIEADKHFWRNTINDLTNIYGRAGGEPRRIVLNNFTYRLIMAEFSRDEVFTSNTQIILGLKVLIDNTFHNERKIVIEIDDRA